MGLRLNALSAVLFLSIGLSIGLTSPSHATPSGSESSKPNLSQLSSADLENTFEKVIDTMVRSREQSTNLDPDMEELFSEAGKPIVRLRPYVFVSDAETARQILGNPTYGKLVKIQNGWSFAGIDDLVNEIGARKDPHLNERVANTLEDAWTFYAKHPLVFERFLKGVARVWTVSPTPAMTREIERVIGGETRTPMIYRELLLRELLRAATDELHNQPKSLTAAQIELLDDLGKGLHQLGRKQLRSKPWGTRSEEAKEVGGRVWNTLAEIESHHRAFRDELAKLGRAQLAELPSWKQSRKKYPPSKVYTFPPQEYLADFDLAFEGYAPLPASRSPYSCLRRNIVEGLP